MALRIATAVYLLSALAIASGCVPSKYPLSDEKTSTADERLIGTWVQSGDRQEEPLVLRRRGDNNLVEDGEGEALFTSSAGDEWYISSRDKDEETGEVSWNIFAYEIVENGRLYEDRPDCHRDCHFYGMRLLREVEVAEKPE